MTSPVSGLGDRPDLHRGVRVGAEAGDADALCRTEVDLGDRHLVQTSQSPGAAFVVQLGQQGWVPGPVTSEVWCERPGRHGDGEHTERDCDEQVSGGDVADDEGGRHQDGLPAGVGVPVGPQGQEQHEGWKDE